MGALCPWVEAGVGAIATQSMVKVSYGPQGLKLLRAGKSAQEALHELLEADKENALRQVAMVDVHGNVAVHTGSRCIVQAGHVAGKDFSVQANMMKKNTVWTAMANAFMHSSGTLAERMLGALQAAQAEGGDIRGKQSAAMLVTDGIRSREPYEHVLINLRVEDHPEPLLELERLLNIQRAYEHMNAGDELLSKGKSESAMEQYTLGAGLAPHIEELSCWQAVTLAEAGDMEKALPIFRSVFKKNQNWAELLKRLPASELFPNNPKLIETILQELPK